MLGSIRKFSSSIYAKIFLAIIIMPFIFWGMGPVFQGGKQNIIVEIGKEKFSTQEFIDFVRRRTNNEDNLDNNLIKKSDKDNMSYIYTGLQIIKPSVFSDLTLKAFSINKIWDKLIKNNHLCGTESKIDFFHVSTLKIYKNLLKKFKH